MQQRVMAHSGLSVSALGLGCNNFGWMIDDAASDAVIARALELGINFFDTADVYGDSEIVLGRALAPRRHEVIIATKFGMSGKGVPGGASPAYVRTAAERSLRRLNTDYLDVLYLHRPDPAVPLADTLGAIDTLIREGKVRHAAASNMSPEQLRASAQAAAASRLHGFIATQEQYNLLARQIEQQLVATAAQLDIAIIPYFPLASGLLTGKYRRGVAPAQGTRLATWKPLSATLLTEANFDRVERLQGFAEAHGHKLAELAIAWLLAQPFVPSVIAGATSVAQLEANAAALSWRLGDSELAQIEQFTAA